MAEAVRDAGSFLNLSCAEPKNIFAARNSKSTFFLPDIILAQTGLELAGSDMSCPFILLYTFSFGQPLYGLLFKKLMLI